MTTIDLDKKTLLQKLHEARMHIRSSKIEKDGSNTFSKYKYFTPELVESLVLDACNEVGLVYMTHLREDEYGLYQVLELSHSNTPDEEGTKCLYFDLRTKHGEVTATNATQQMGSTDTYSDRYIKMKVFAIKDNSMDVDSKDNRPKNKKYPASGAELKFDMTLRHKEVLLELCEGKGKPVVFLAGAKTMKDYYDKKEVLESLPDVSA